MSPERIADAVSIGPFWVKAVGGIWLICSCILIWYTVFYAIPAATAPANNQAIISDDQPYEEPVATVSVLKPPFGNSSDLLSLREYLDQLHALDGRFLEREEFIKQHHGRNVEHIGIVEDVSTATTDTHLLVMFSRQDYGPPVLAWLPEAMKTKAFSLRKGDTAMVRGILDTQGSLCRIHGTELRLLKTKP